MATWHRVGSFMSSSVHLMNRVAETDATFLREGSSWRGKCLICGGPLRFDARTGEGANLEHILPRGLGGTHDLLNLGVTHLACNGEKGRHWDGGQRRRADPGRYRALVDRLRSERQRRWRAPRAHAHTPE